MVCPDPDELHSMILTDRLEDDGAVVDHIARCNDCQRMIEGWIADDKDYSIGSQSTNISKSVAWTDELGARLVEGVRASLHSESTSTPEFPEKLGRYRVLEPVGEGGMGTVLKARQEGLNRIVALKVIRRRSFGKQADARRFRAEAESVAKLDHPGIVPIFEVSEQGPYIFYAMSYVAGGTLADKCRSGPINWQEAARLGEQIAVAISYAHKHGIIHRDLKPSNVLLADNDQPRIADFGLAKHLTDSDDITATGEILGTPAFMSPEQAAGQTKSISTLVDVYGIGGILFALLSGKPPFPGEDPVAVIYRVIHQASPSLRRVNPDVPLDLATIVDKCLSKRPSDRYSSAEAVAEDLARLIQGRMILAKPLTPMQRATRWIVRNPTTVTLLGLLISVTVFGGGVAAYYRVLANRRQAALSSQASDLATAKLSADQSAVDAERDLLRVKEQAGAAVSLLEEMVFKVQKTYAGNPAAQKERRELLQSALERLDRIEVEHVKPLRVSRLRAKALASLGEVIMQVGDGSGPAGISATRPYFEKSIAISRQLHRDYPGHVEVAADLASSLIEFGDTLAFAGAWREANQLFDQALPLSQSLVESQPKDLRMHEMLANNLMLSGEALSHLNQNAEGKTKLLEAAKKLEQLHQENPESYSVYLQLSLCWQEIGDWCRKMKKYAEGTAAYERMLEIAAGMCAKFPLDSGSIMALGSAHERLGDLAQDQGNFQEALQQQERGLELVEVLRTNSPNNDFVHWQVAFSYHKVAILCRRLGNVERARELIEECVQVRLSAVEADSANREFRSKLISSLRVLASVCQMQKETSRELEALLLAREHLDALQPGKIDDSLEKRIQRLGQPKELQD